MKNIKAFTMIELMIVVVIIAVLAAVAIPAYLSYIRRSYLSDANSSISAIKMAEEDFFSRQGCYIEATAYPATVPANTQVTWNATGPWAANGLSVRPDRRTRFQYEVLASNALSGTTCSAPAASRPTGSLGCIPDMGTLVPASIFPDHWYIVLARGDLDGDGTTSLIVSAIDDTAIMSCDDLE